MKITCFCEHSQEIEFPEHYDLQDNPETEDRILEGSFQSVTCENCGKLLKPELPARITDSHRNIDIAYYPELERESYLQGKLAPPAANRLVFGFSELREKFLILRDNYDDRVIELIKLFMLQKTEHDPDKITVLYHETSTKGLVFHIHGIKKDEVGVTSITREMYDRVQTDLLSNNAFEDPELKDLIQGPYVSVRAFTIQEEE